MTEWILVPKEPTPEMLMVGQQMFDMPFNKVGGELNPDTAAQRLYAAMLAARPAQPADEAVVERVAEAIRLAYFGEQECAKKPWDKLEAGYQIGWLACARAALAAIPPQPDDFTRGWVAGRDAAAGYHTQCAANFDAHLAKVKSTKATPDIARWVEIERQAEVHREHAAAISALTPPASAREG